MTVPRRAQVSLEDTPYYHCIARCVRRAFLCGDDTYSGQSFNHRRQWLVDRLRHQSEVFGIHICAYAILSNHYHVVLRVDGTRVAGWSDEEVITRWCSLFRGPLLVQRRLAGEQLSEPEQETVDAIVSVWRKRLTSISWFMRCLNEFIARKANAEDDCTGRFWEGRFKSQALLDDAAVLSCMAYVDLNPLRAGLADDLSSSDFTSIQERLSMASQCRNKQSGRGVSAGTSLLGFNDTGHAKLTDVMLPVSLSNYIDLVEWTGRAVRNQLRRGQATATLNEVGLSEEQWLELTLNVQQASPRAVGCLEAVRKYSRSIGRSWLSGQRNLARIYGQANPCLA